MGNVPREFENNESLSIIVLFFDSSVNEDGVPIKKLPTDQHKKFMDAPEPDTPGKMRSFLGLARVLAPFVPGLQIKLRDLNRLAHAEKQYRTMFTDEHSKLIKEIKSSLQTIDGLHFYDERYPVVAATDACNDGIGGVIYQVTDKGEYRILHWFAEPFSTPAQANWATNKKECYAISQLLHKNYEFLIGVPFILLTDHRNLVFLTNQEDGMMRRIQIFISQFEVEFRYVPGIYNILPDKMSRVFSENKDSQEKWRKEMESYEAQAMKRDKSATHHKYRVTSDSLMIGAPRPDKQAEERLSQLSPRKLKLLATFHGIFTGHHGWRQTLELLRVHGHYWKDIEKDVRDYVKNCVICQKTRAFADNRQLLERTHPLYEKPRAIGETIEVDLCQLPESTDGHNYVCVMIDIPSRYIYVRPQRNKDATSTACSLMDYMSVFGTPRQIRSDGGSEFINELWDSLLTFLKVKRHKTAPHRSQSHGTVENANRQLITLLRSSLFSLSSETKHWHLFLPRVQWLLNRVIHHDTGISSSDWVFGLKGPHMNSEITEIDSEPIDWDKRHKKKTKKVLESLPEATYFEEFERINRILTHSIHSHLILYHKNKIKKLDERNKGKNPFIAKKGQFVLYSDPTRAALDKLKPRRLGPWTVVDHDPIRGHYTLRDTSDDKIYTNIDQEFVYPMLMHENTISYEDLIKYAALDREETFVTDVLEHRWEKTRTKETLWLRVRYHDDQEWWCEYKDVRDSACVQWYILTTTTLHNFSKSVFRTEAARKAKYSELKAQYDKSKEPGNTTVTERKGKLIENPRPPKVPQMTFTEHQELQNDDSTRVKHSLENVFHDVAPPKITTETKKQVSFKLNKPNDELRDTIMRERGLRRMENKITGEVRYVTPSNYRQIQRQKKLNNWQKRRH